MTDSGQIEWSFSLLREHVPRRILYIPTHVSFLYIIKCIEAGWID
jgi:hypothetical protein